MKAYLVLALFIGILFQPIPKQTDKPQPNQNDSKQLPTQPQQSATGGTEGVGLSGPSSPEKQDGANSKPKRATWCDKVFGPVWANWPLLLVAVWGILVARSTLNAIEWQARETANATKAMRDSGDATKKRERAKLTVRIEEVSIVGIEGGGKFQEVGVAVVHYGPTHAFNVRATADLVCTPSLDPIPLPDGRHETYIPDVIKSGSEPFVFGVMRRCKQSELDGIQDGTLFLHCVGILTYEDVFDDAHRTPFRYYWTVKGHHEGFGEAEHWEDDSGWEKYGPPEDNRAT